MVLSCRKEGSEGNASDTSFINKNEMGRSGEKVVCVPWGTVIVVAVGTSKKGKRLIFQKYTHLLFPASLFLFFRCGRTVAVCATVVERVSEERRYCYVCHHRRSGLNAGGMVLNSNNKRYRQSQGACHSFLCVPKEKNQKKGQPSRWVSPVRHNPAPAVQKLAALKQFAP